MFEKYTEKARRTIFFARYEVRQVGGAAMNPEHILLGLLREDKSLIPRLLTGREESVKAAIRERIVEHYRAGEKVAEGMDVPLGPEAKQVLLLAAEESEAMEHLHIGTEHLLLGLLRAEGSVAAAVLNEQGISYAGVRQAIEEMYGG